MSGTKIKSKAAIIGAGNVGSSAAFAMTLRQSVSELVMLDVNHKKAEGEAMDINHGLSFLGMMDIYSGDYEDIKDCDVIIITAGQNRKPGETRLDLAKNNVAIARTMIDDVMKYYNGGVILVVSNPVDILTYVMQKWSGLPHGRVMGTGTALDTSRFRYNLSARLDVDVRNVHGYIIGEHGDSQLPSWSSTHIAGRKIEDYINDAGGRFGDKDKLDIAEEVKTAGAEIIKNKGSTHYAIAIAVANIVETLVKNQNTIRTVSSVMNGMYGISDVALSIPSMININGVYDYLNLTLSDSELQGLRGSAQYLREVLDMLGV